MSAGKRKFDKKIVHIMTIGIAKSKELDFHNDTDMAVLILLCLRQNGYDVIRKDQRWRNN